MEDKKETIEKLKARLEEIKPILNKRFKTSEELNRHIEKYKKLYEEGKELHDKVNQLELELMSPEERENKQKLDRFLELKAKGEPFDLSEFEDL